MSLYEKVSNISNMFNINKENLVQNEIFLLHETIQFEINNLLKNINIEDIIKHLFLLKVNNRITYISLYSYLKNYFQSKENLIQFMNYLSMPFYAIQSDLRKESYKKTIDRYIQQVILFEIGLFKRKNLHLFPEETDFNRKNINTFFEFEYLIAFFLIHLNINSESDIEKKLKIVFNLSNQKGNLYTDNKVFLSILKNIIYINLFQTEYLIENQIFSNKSKSIKFDIPYMDHSNKDNMDEIICSNINIYIYLKYMYIYLLNSNITFKHFTFNLIQNILFSRKESNIKLTLTQFLSSSNAKKYMLLILNSTQLKVYFLKYLLNQRYIHIYCIVLKDFILKNHKIKAYYKNYQLEKDMKEKQNCQKIKYCEELYVSYFTSIEFKELSKKIEDYRIYSFLQNIPDYSKREFDSKKIIYNKSSSSVKVFNLDENNEFQNKAFEENENKEREKKTNESSKDHENNKTNGNFKDYIEFRHSNNSKYYLKTIEKKIVAERIMWDGGISIQKIKNTMSLIRKDSLYMNNIRFNSDLSLSYINPIRTSNTYLDEETLTENKDEIGKIDITNLIKYVNEESKLESIELTQSNSINNESIENNYDIDYFLISLYENIENEVISSSNLKNIFMLYNKLNAVINNNEVIKIKNIKDKYLERLFFLLKIGEIEDFVKKNVVSYSISKFFICIFNNFNLYISNYKDTVNNLKIGIISIDFYDKFIINEYINTQSSDKNLILGDSYIKKEKNAFQVGYNINTPNEILTFLNFLNSKNIIIMPFIIKQVFSFALFDVSIKTVYLTDEYSSNKINIFISSLYSRFTIHNSNSNWRIVKLSYSKDEHIFKLFLIMKCLFSSVDFSFEDLIYLNFNRNEKNLLMKNIFIDVIQHILLCYK